LRSELALSKVSTPRTIRGWKHFADPRAEVMKMRYGLLAGALILGLSAYGCDAPEENPPEPDPVECVITAPEADALVSGSVDVTVGLTGPVTRVELLVNGEVVADETPEEGATELTVSWDTTTVDDGAAELLARVEGETEEVTDESEMVAVVVDNTAPTASIGLERMEVLEGQATVPVAITEEHIAQVRLLDRDDNELATATEGLEEFSWDTTTVESKVHWLRLEVTDAIGNLTESDEVPVVVVNNGYAFDDDEVDYDPSGWVFVPDPFDATVEIDLRMYPQMDLIDADNVVRVITWLTWDPVPGVELGYNIGQGICPHRGLPFYEIGTEPTSEEGEIILDIAWDDLDPDLQRTAIDGDADGYEEGSGVFPYDGDILTRGTFFSHVRPVDPETHEGLELLTTVHFVVIYHD
jgi:hypothetical protein